MLRNLPGPKAHIRDRDLIYLIQFARKHNLTANNLHDSLLATWQSGDAQCGTLLIEIRSREERSSTYMFSLKGRLLAQANIQNDSIRKLVRLPEGFTSFLDVDERRRSNKLDANIVSAIGDLRFGLSGVSFKASVVRKSEVRAVTSKEGNPLLVCDIMLSDGTGEIPLAVWNGQIGTVSLGDMVQVQNARVRSYRGEIQLALGRKTGFLTVLEHATENVA